MKNLRRIAAAAPLSNGGRDGHEATVRKAISARRRPHRANDSAPRVCDTDELVAGRGAASASPAVRLHTTGRGAGERADAYRALATRMSVVAAECRCRAFEGAGCDGRLAINDAEGMSIDARIAAGDRIAVVDAAVAAGTMLLDLAADMSELLTDDREALIRLAEVRMRQDRTGRQWHGASISGDFDQDTGTTDRAGKEPRGPRRAAGKPRQAKAGKPAKQRGKRASS